MEPRAPLRLEVTRGRRAGLGREIVRDALKPRGRKLVVDLRLEHLEMDVHLPARRGVGNLVLAGNGTQDGVGFADPLEQQLVEEIARTDIVVATRFHNVLLGLMLKRPVVAISYHPKIASLMEAMDLSQYCQDIEHLDVAGLIRQFSELERNRSTVQALIERKTAECRRALDEQYDAVFERR